MGLITVTQTVTSPQHSPVVASFSRLSQRDCEYGEMMEPSEDFADVLTAVQEGEFEVVQEVIGGRIVPVNAVDQSGCSLLHWAAINNRVVIARLLIENGLTKSSPGGVLGETPLQWALRKKYYLMMEVIFKQTQCDLSVKSVQGNDALHLACKLGDVNGAFLVLTWGANPDSRDNNGDTPLLWILRNKPLGTGSAAQELIKMLLRFGASPTLDNGTDGNSPLHVLAVTKKPDMKVCFLIYTAAGAVGKSVTNKEGLTAYSLAVSTDNRDYARFLYDAMMFEMFPYWMPALAGCALVTACAGLIQFFGLIYGLVYWAILYTATAWTVLQWQVVEHRDRAITGAYIGFSLCQLATYRVYIAHHTSYFMNIVVLLVVCVWATAGFYFVRRKPASLPKSENRAQLAERIIHSAPTEGTDEECLLIESETNEPFPEDADSEHGGAHDHSSGAQGLGSRFVKDTFTGQLRRVDSAQNAAAESAAGARSPGNKSHGHNHASGRNQKSNSISGGRTFLKGRTLGPKLCGCCLADRRLYVKSHMTEVTLPESALVTMLLPPVANAKASTSAGANGAAGSGNTSAREKRASSISGLGITSGAGGAGGDTAVGQDVIAIATHCEVCSACVIDQDQHSIFLGNCVGKGNRRWYWLFLAAGTLFCLLYFLTAKYVQHWHSCADNAAVTATFVLFRPFAAEYCVLSAEGAFFLLTWTTAYCGLYFLMMLQVQVSSVARETTFRNIIKRRYEMTPAPYRRRMRNVLTFLYSGLYNITYPKTNARGRSDSLNSVGTAAGGGAGSAGSAGSAHAHGGVPDPRSVGSLSPVHSSPAEEKAQYQQALRMLKGIDQKLSGESSVGLAELGAGAVPLPPLPAVGKSATTTYIPPQEEDLLDLSPPPVAAPSGCESKGCQHCDDVEVFSDYDTEFIESEQNNYATYYFNDSDGEVESRPLLGAGGGAGSAHVHSDACKHGSSGHHHGGSGGNSSSAGGAGSAKKRSTGGLLIDADERL